jgi:carboxylesterase
VDPNRQPRSQAGTTGSEGGAPFDLPGGPDAALLLHGLTGSPFEMLTVARRLNARGLRCRGPLMAGHGGDPRALIGVSWEEWVEGARRELEALEGARRLLVVGCSMGALVACELARTRPPRVDALALLAPAFRLRAAGRVADFLARRTPLARLVPLWPKFGGSDVRDKEMRAKNPSMAALPLEAVASLGALARHLEPHLSEIAVPTLLVLGGQDHTVSSREARRLATRFRGASRVVELAESYHLVGIDVERERCAEVVDQFFGEVPETRGSTG